MRLFLVRFLFFCVMLICFFAINLLVNHVIISNTKLPFSQSNIIIVGDSHIKYGIDPSFFFSARTISQESEPYYITYLKLKYLIPIAKVDTAMIGFSEHNISVFNDQKLFDTKWSSELFRRNYIFWDDMIKFNDIKIDYLELFRIYFRNMCLFPKTNHINLLEEFPKLNQTNLTDIDIVINRHYPNQEGRLEISEIAIIYLDSIINLCTRSQITPILVRPPVHKYYFDRIPESVSERYKLEETKFLNKGFLVINSQDNFFEDNYYLNTDHLNQTGASKFTAQLIELIESSKTHK